MTTILCLETSEKNCSVALSIDGQCERWLQSNEDQSHAKKLTVLVADLLKSVGTSIAHLDAVAISCGPGSYTGLRIGMSVAKGICWAQSKKLIAVNTLEIIKEGGQKKHPDFKVIIPTLDARRNEVFRSEYLNGQEVIPTSPLILDQNPLLGHLQEPVLVLGSGASKYQPYLKPSDVLDPELTAHATLMCKLAHLKYNQEKFEDLAYFEPTYFKAVHTTISKKKLFI